MNLNVNEYLTIHLSTKMNEITIVMKCRTIKFLKCKFAKLTEFYQTYSNVTSFFISKPASLYENVQDFTGENMTPEGKQSFISPYNKGHKLFIIPKFHTQQNIFFKLI